MFVVQGHLDDDLPAQLDDVPPTLAELVAKKLKSPRLDKDKELRTSEAPSD